MPDRIIALSDRLSDFELAYVYLPCAHYALKQIQNKFKTVILAPKKFWAEIYRLGSFHELIIYPDTLEEMFGNVKKSMRDLICFGPEDVELVAERLHVDVKPIDRIQITNNKFRLLRSLAADRHDAKFARNKGVMACIAPDLDQKLASFFFRELHCNLGIPAIMPVPAGYTIETKVPYGLFEMRTTMFRLVELLLMSRVCIGPPGPFTYLAIHLNIPTAIIGATPDISDKLGLYWGHAKCISVTPMGLPHDAIHTLEEAINFYEYLLG